MATYELNISVMIEAEDIHHAEKISNQVMNMIDIDETVVDVIWDSLGQVHY